MFTTNSKNRIYRSFVLLAFIFAGTVCTNAQLFIEAEDFSDAVAISNAVGGTGIDTESSSDVGGGKNIGWIDNNDWIEYNVEIPMTGDYEISFRAASENGGGNISILVNSDSLTSLGITSTGGWQTWNTITSTTSISLTEGTHSFRLLAASGGFNLNWWSLTLTSPSDSDAPSNPVIASDTTTHNSVMLYLTPSTDATSSVNLYQILINDVHYAYSADTSVFINGLPTNSSTDISIIAFDIAGNASGTTSYTAQTDTLPWKLAWSDEFDYTGKPDPTKWRYETGGGGWGNGESQYYTDGDNADVANGNLIITAKKESYGGNEFTSTRLNSKDEVDFLYGRIEVKAKLPSTNGTWPAIWTLPTDWVYGGWPNCGEIDIMEHSATYNYGYVFGTVHTGAYNHSAGTQKGGGITFDDVTNTYHTYAIEWYPDYIEWFVDDVLIFRFDNEYKTTAEWPYDIPHHLILNIAIGGGLGGDIDLDGTWPQEMIIDYVRVYDFELGKDDDIDPEEPTNLSVTPKWTTADVNWNLSKDNYAVEYYYVFLDGVKIDSVIGTEYALSELIETTEYIVGLQAKDYAGNLSDTVFHTFSTTEITGMPVPGVIQAEDYTNAEGIDAQDTEDSGGGENIGWIDANDWMTYTIDVKEDIEYRAGFRMASESAGSIQLLDEDNSEIISVSTPNTGDWQAWQTVVSEPFTLNTGLQTIKVTTNTGGFNLNWIEIKGKDDFVGINQISSESLALYPNPLRGNSLTVKLSGTQESSMVYITAMDGKTLYSARKDVINGQIELHDLNLKQGLYIVSVISENQLYTQTLDVL